jgi:tetratricopeptide (TPR) repeat protein
MLYGPAVMLACGRGFYQPGLDASPALGEFLRNERESLSPEDLPKDLPEEPNSVSSYHRYLLYTVAFFWRLKGISWSSLEPLAALLLGLCAIGVYGLMRLGMGRLLSLFITLFFVLSPQMLTMLPSLRDFSKAPFILALIFLSGLLIKNRFRFIHLLLFSAVMGLINGIALGFRQDALVFVLPALALLTIAGLRERNWPWLHRLLPPTLFILFFLFTGNPMLGRMEGGAQPYHPMVQGFSMKRAASLGMEPGVYEPLASGGDNYTFSMLYDYYKRASNDPNSHFEFNDSGSEIAGRHFLLDMGKYFPADLLTRGYAALLRTLRYTDGIPVWTMLGSPWMAAFKNEHEMIKHHFHYYGFIYALITILLISSRSLPMAFGVFFFILYICGYTSLQCEFRHTFHLSFIPLWIVGFLAQRLFTGIRDIPKATQLKRSQWLKPIKRACIFAVSATVMATAPLYALRAFQHYRAEPLLDAIVNAKRTPIPVESLVKPGWTCFMLNELEPPTVKETLREDMSDIQALCAILCTLYVNARGEDESPNWHTKVRYFALELAWDSDLRWLTVLYDSELPYNNFSQLFRIRLPKSETGSIWYFFPAYELKMPSPAKIARNHFTGIALPEAQAKSFRGLHEIRDISSIRFLLHATLPGDSLVSNRMHATLMFAPDPVDAFRVDDEPAGVIGMAEAAERFGKTDEAYLFYTASLLLNRETVQRLYVAQALMKYGDLDMVGTLVLECAQRPDVEADFAASLLTEVLKRLAAKHETSAADELLRTLSVNWMETHPEALLQVLGSFAGIDSDKIVQDHLASFLNKYPENISAADMAETLFSPQGYSKELETFWEQITQNRPESVLPFVRLGHAFSAGNDINAARNAYISAYTNNNVHPEASLWHAVVVLAETDPEKSFAQIDQVLTSAPEWTSRVALALEHTADRLNANSAYDYAARVYDKAFQIAPGNYELKIKQTQSLRYNHHYVEALGILEEILPSEEKEDALILMDEILAESLSPEEGIARWEELSARHPQVPEIVLHLARSLFALGRYPEAAAKLAAVHNEETFSPESGALLVIAKFTAGMLSPEEAAEAPVWHEHPELVPTSEKVLQTAIHHFEDQGNTDMAKKTARLIALLKPESEAGWMIMGRIQEDSGAFDDALATYWQSFEHASVENQHQIAQRIDALYDRLNRPEEALQKWQVYAGRLPDNPAVLFHLGIAHESNQQWMEAEDIYKELSENTSFANLIGLRLGLVVARRDTGLGIERIQSALDADPTLKPLGAMLSLQAGNDLFEAKQAAQAEQLYRFAATLNPEDPFIHLHLGDALQMQGNMQDAQSAWTRAISLEPDSPAAGEAGRRMDASIEGNARKTFWSHLMGQYPDALLPKARYALALAVSGDEEKAVSLCASLVEQVPDNVEVRLACSLIFCQIDQIDRGLQEIEWVLKQSPFLANEILEQLADISIAKLEKGFPDQAEPLIRKAIVLGPHNLLYYLHLGRILLAQDRFEEALEQFRKVLLEVPESPNAAKLLDQAWDGMNNPEMRYQDWESIVDAHPEAEIPRQHLDALKQP